MSLFYIAILILVLIGTRNRLVISLDSALGISQANCIKGIFILFVFLSHIQPYMLQSGYVLKGIDGKILRLFDIGQNVVVMFLFYSGYGIHQQILKRGNDYVKKIPLHRMLNTLLNFDVAVLLFLALNLILKTPVEPIKILAAFTGWESLGNSNWYIFDIIVLYGLVWSAHIIADKQVLQWFWFSILTIAFVLIMYMCRHDMFWWWDTILCFWGGYSLSCIKEKIAKHWEHHWWEAIAICIVAFLIFKYGLRTCWHLHHMGFIPAWLKIPWLLSNLMHLTFGVCIVLLSMKLKCQSKFLEWCGRHLFPIYIYQRLPMMAVPLPLVAQYSVAYVAFCLVVTLGVAYLYKYWKIKI